jgi:hypothetical protein
MDPMIDVQDVLATLWNTLHFFQNFNQLYIGGVWWIGILIDPHNHNMCMIYRWTLYLIFKLGFKYDFLNFSFNILI